jgi:alkylation response protein AidB-like acyl-CoA dehydrogenase
VKEWKEIGKGIVKGGEFLISTISPEDIFIPEDMSEDQRLLAKILEDFLRGELEPRIKDLEAKIEGLMVELLEKSAKAGFFGVDIPEQFGGMGLDNVSSLIVTEKASIGGPFALANLASITFGALPILYFGSSEQKKRYLPDLASGKKIGAFALTEPDAGTDALSAKTVATLSGDGQHYILNGEKQFISNTGYADIFITYAKIDGEDFTAFILDRDSEGLSFGQEEDKMGIRGTSTRSLILENARVPVNNLLFQIGKGHVVAFNTLNLGRYKLSGACLGMAKLAFKDSLQYSKNRMQFGQSISNFGLIKEKIGEMAIRIFVAESMTYRTSRLLEEAVKGITKTANDIGFGLVSRIEEYAPECSINKVYASEMLDYVVDEAVQIHGGYGYIKDYPVEQYYRDSRIYRIFGGTNEINRLLILRMLLKRAEKGQFHLRNSIEKVTSEILMPSATPYSQGKDLEDLGRLVENAKKIVFLLLEAVSQILSNSLEHHQEVTGMISNIIIEIFAMESCLLRARKINQKFGEEYGEIPTNISQVYVLDAFMRVEHWAKLIFAAIAEGEILRNKLSDLRILTQYLPINSVGLRRKIADSMLKARQYFIF